MPFKINYEFLGLLRRGPSYLWGPTQELKAEFIDLNIEMQSCQTINRKIKTGYDESEELKLVDEDDDFDEEDEDEEKAPSKSGLEMGTLASAVCSMKDVINKFMPQVEENWRGTFDITEPNMVRGHVASYNEYHPLVEKTFALWLSCAGVDTR